MDFSEHVISKIAEKRTPADLTRPLPEKREMDRPRESRATRLKVLFLITTFPLSSETFIQREIRCLRNLPVEIDLYSLWGGANEFEGLKVNRFPKWRLIALLWRLPYWMARKPSAFINLGKHLFERQVKTPLDFGMTLVGIFFAVCYASHFSQPENRPQIIHAAWATMPATAAQLLRVLLKIPFSFQAHAYDIFRNGGDWLLPSKLRESSLIIVSTKYGRESLISRGGDASRIAMIRQGIDEFPPQKTLRKKRAPLRILSVGRLIEKKGFSDQLALLAELKRSGLEFEARIVGGGRCAKALTSQWSQLCLNGTVQLLGPRPNGLVIEQLQWADVFIYTGKQLANGDSDGLPNVIAEAMAVGVPVVSTGVAGVREAITDEQTGVLMRNLDHNAWRSALERLRDDDEYYMGISKKARAWVNTNFDARTNVSHICHQWRVLLTRAKTSSSLYSVNSLNNPSIASHAASCDD